MANLKDIGALFPPPPPQTDPFRLCVPCALTLLGLEASSVFRVSDLNLQTSKLLFWNHMFLRSVFLFFVRIFSLVFVLLLLGGDGSKQFAAHAAGAAPRQSQMREPRAKERGGESESSKESLERIH